MKIIFVEQARVLWLFQTLELNPSGKYLIPLLMELTKRYKFANIPNVAEAIKKNEGIVLGQGTFTHSSITYAVDFGIYKDGLIADCKASTDVSEALLEDALKWVQEEYQLAYPRHIRKQYFSKIHVEIGKSLASLSEKLAAISDLLSERLSGFGNGVKYELGGITLISEQVGPITPLPFRFERLEGQPFALNRYYSFAPLPTVDHLALLGRIEEILA